MLAGNLIARSFTSLCDGRMLNRFVVSIRRIHIVLDCAEEIWRRTLTIKCLVFNGPTGVRSTAHVLAVRGSLLLVTVVAVGVPGVIFCVFFCILMTSMDIF